MTDEKIKVLMAMPALENHTRGLFTVASMLKDAGMEIVLLGNQLPEQIIEVAIQEDTKVIGISTYCGSPVIFGNDLFKAAQEKGIKDTTVFVIGGIFPPQDEPQLLKMGFSGVFPPGPGATRERIVSCIKDAVHSKRSLG
ncbi:MAG: cobalamin-dependent protein [Thermodesulfobacteriota bacterium]|nr:cobalamin-dependent protein [Thermodesulfobacteriota bacterium]